MFLFPLFLRLHLRFAPVIDLGASATGEDVEDNRLYGDIERHFESILCLEERDVACSKEAEVMNSWGVILAEPII
jgi:hypothetical protein